MSRRDWGVVAGLWLAVLVYFWDALLGGQSLAHLATADVYVPYNHITSGAMNEGRIPHWEPRIGLGYPFQSDPHSVCFYPPAVLFLLLPFARAYNVFTILHIALGGTFMFALLRRWELSRTSSALGALVLMFCGYTVTSTCLPTLLRGAVWTPLALLAFDSFVMTGSRRSLLATALVLAIEGSGTDPQYVLFTGVVVLLASWLRPGAPRSRWPANVAGGCAAGIVALLLLAYQYLPLARLLMLSDRTGGVAGYETAMWFNEPANLYNLVLPLPFPHASHAWFWTNYSNGSIPFYVDLYWGFPAAAFAVASLGWLFAPGSRGRAALAALLVTLVALVLSMGDATPVYGWLTAIVPPLKAFRFAGKYHMLAAVAFPLAVALGLEGVVQSVSPCVRAMLAALGASALACLVAAGALAATGTALPRAFLIRDGSTYFGDVEGLLQTVRGAWLAGLLFALGLLLLLAFLLAAGLRGKLSWPTAVGLAAALAAGELAWSTWQAVLLVPEAAIFARRQTLAEVERAGRGTVPPRFTTTLPPAGLMLDAENTFLKFLLLSVDNAGDVRGVMQGCANAFGSMSIRLAHHTRLTDALAGVDHVTESRALAVLGVSHVFDFQKPREPLPERPAREILRAGPIVVRELEGVGPRAFIPRRAVPGTGLTTASVIAGLRETAPYDGAEVLEPAAVRRCEIVRYEPDRVEIEIDVQGRGLLVLTDAWYPYWTATVDGKPRPVRRVAGVVRGVPVEQGERAVVMTYRPAPFWTGAAISLAVLATVALALMRVSGTPHETGRPFDSRLRGSGDT